MHLTQKTQLLMTVALRSLVHLVPGAVVLRTDVRPLSIWGQAKKRSKLSVARVLHSPLTKLITSVTTPPTQPEVFSTRTQRVSSPSHEERGTSKCRKRSWERQTACCICKGQIATDKILRDVLNVHLHLL